MIYCRSQPLMPANPRPDEHERCGRAPHQKFLHGVQTLQRINLTGTHCTAPGLAALKAALPKCKIIGP